MSEFFTRKLKSGFSTLDVFTKGFISKDDWLQFGERLLEGVTADEDQKEEVRWQLLKTFRNFTKVAGSGDDVLMTEEIFLESVKTLKDDPAFHRDLYSLALSFIGPFDTNNDGFLQPDEHRRYFETIGISEVETFGKIAFEALDVNGDGKLSKEEFCSAFENYFTSDDESHPIVEVLDPAW